MPTIATEKAKKSAATAAPEKQFSLSEYLAKEESAQHKHEYHNGQIIAMHGSKIKHNIIATNLTTAIKSAVKNLLQKFFVINSDQKIYIPQVNKVLYADALVICEEPELWEDREDLLLNPLLIVEVASKSMRNYDRGEKFMSYRLIPSFREYILVEQDKPLVENWFRSKPNTWEITAQEDTEQSVFLQSLGVFISLQDIYEHISLNSIN